MHVEASAKQLIFSFEEITPEGVEEIGEKLREFIKNCEKPDILQVKMKDDKTIILTCTTKPGIVEDGDTCGR